MPKFVEYMRIYYMLILENVFNKKRERQQKCANANVVCLDCSMVGAVARFLTLVQRNVPHTKEKTNSRT
ncbi:unnamed protein product, partial [Ceratitis capitata]